MAEDGRLLLGKLLMAGQEFLQQESERWMGRFALARGLCQPLLQAVLQRVVNSGRRMEREYGLGRMRTDLPI